MSLFEIQRICASPASPSAIFLQEGVVEWDFEKEWILLKIIFF